MVYPPTVRHLAPTSHPKAHVVEPTQKSCPKSHVGKVWGFSRKMCQSAKNQNFQNFSLKI